MRNYLRQLRKESYFIQMIEIFLWLIAGVVIISLASLVYSLDK